MGATDNNLCNRPSEFRSLSVRRLVVVNNVWLVVHTVVGGFRPSLGGGLLLAEMGPGTWKAGDRLLMLPQHGRSSSPQRAPELHFQVQKTEAGGWPDKGSATTRSREQELTPRNCGGQGKQLIDLK